MKKDSKGMTLVEFLVALSIFSILITMVYSVYNTNIKSMNKTQIKGQLQSEAQIIQRVISNIAMQSNGIKKVNIENEDNDGYFEIGFIDMELEVEEDSFKTYRLDIDTDFTEKDSAKILRLQQIENNLTENKVVKEWELSKNIDSFKMKPIGSDAFKDAKSIDSKIVLKRKKGFIKEDYQISTIISFRNKQ